MSAERLREAAALMRSRAEAATPGPWECLGDHLVWPSDKGPGANDPILALMSETHENSGEHIASWHPAVALAVAKAMDDVALAWEISDGWVRDLDDDEIRFEDTVDGGWLKVADAYLGATS